MVDMNISNKMSLFIPPTFINKLLKFANEDPKSLLFHKQIFGREGFWITTAGSRNIWMELYVLN